MGVPHTSVSPIAIGERLNGGREIGSGEVGPQDVGEVKLGVGRLPQQEVTQPLFSAGADQQIDVGVPLGAWIASYNERSNASWVGDIPLARRPAAASSPSRAE